MKLPKCQAMDMSGQMDGYPPMLLFVRHDTFVPVPCSDPRDVWIERRCRFDNSISSIDDMIYVTYVYRFIYTYYWNTIEIGLNLLTASGCFALQSYIPHLRSEVTWTLRALCSYPSLNKKALPYPGEHNDGHDTDIWLGMKEDSWIAG